MWAWRGRCGVLTADAASASDMSSMKRGFSLGASGRSSAEPIIISIIFCGGRSAPHIMAGGMV